MERQFERVINVLGEEGLRKLQESHVVVFGVGGVGSFAVEALVRSGIGTITLVDFDKIDASNLNRQIEAVIDTVGMNKTDAFEERLLNINPEVRIIKKKLFVDENNVSSCFDGKVDYVIDAIDNMNGKLAIWKYCQNHEIDFIASMGAARRLDPTRLLVTTLNKTEKDPMARKLRYMVKQAGMNNKIKVVYSSEDPLPMTENGVLGSMMFVPATAGLVCASECVKALTEI